MGIYQELYTLIHQYIYGGVELTADMSLICTLVSTVGCLFILAIPFIIVWLVIKLILGGWQ